MINTVYAASNGVRNDEIDEVRPNYMIDEIKHAIMDLTNKVSVCFVQ